MPLRIRLRAPNGIHTITLNDDAAVSNLLASISEKTELPLFELKWGFPPEPLDPSLYGMSTPLRDTGLNLNGSQIIVLATQDEDIPAPASEPEPSPSASQPQQTPPLNLVRKQTIDMSATPEIKVPARGGTMVLRVMPDDNSCMFRALGSAVLSDSLDSMTELRSLVAQGIQSDPETYNETVLEKSPDDYCQWIQSPDSWGGGIELSILSQHFGIEVGGINVQDLSVLYFNEGRPQRCFLVYSGIHYDTIAFVPDGTPTYDNSQDIKLFDSQDDVMLQAARELCAELQKKKYFTDTQNFTIKCTTCGWRGKGQEGAQVHAKETGHLGFGEADS